MEAILKWEAPDHAIVLKPENEKEAEDLARFQRRPGHITAEIKDERYERFAILKIRKEADE